MTLLGAREGRGESTGQIYHTKPYWSQWLLHFDMAIEEQPANRGPVSLLPHLYPLGLRHLGALVAICMAGVTHGRGPKIVTFLATPFFIPELIGVSGNYRTVLDATDLARGFPQQLQKAFVPVYHRITYFRGLPWMVEILPSSSNSLIARYIPESEAMKYLANCLIVTGLLWVIR